jgi:hypothetical protein
MPVVTNTAKKPGQVLAKPRVSIVLNTSPAFETATDIEVLGGHAVDVDAVTGIWTADLVANTAISPANTKYRVTETATDGTQSVHDIVVPSGGGPYNLADIRSDPLVALPTTEPSNEKDSFAPASNSANLAVSGFTFVPVPDFIVDVPDLAQPLLLMGWVNMFHTTVANAILYAGIAAVGVTALASTKGLGNARAGAANTGITVPFVGRLPAHSAGSYQVGVNGDAGNVVVVGGTNGITLCTALAV